MKPANLLERPVWRCLQRLRFDLPNPFTRDRALFADLFEGAIGLLSDSESHPSRSALRAASESPIPCAPSRRDCPGLPVRPLMASVGPRRDRRASFAPRHRWEFRAKLVL
jgi:hypothetical protein